MNAARLARAIMILGLVVGGHGSALAEIRIGIAGPLSGNALPVGEQQEIGASAAINDLNEAGGVLGQEIVATSVDDACDGEQAKAAARQLVSEAVVFVVGHVCSAASIAAGPIYDAAKIVMISPASTNPKVTDAGHPNVFRVIGRDDQQGAFAGEFIAENYQGRNIAIIHDGQAYGEGLAEITRRELNRRGVRETLFVGFEPDRSDYKELVDRLVAAKIDVVYAGGYQGDLGIIVRQTKQSLPEVQFVGADALTSSEFRFIAGEAAEGTLLTFGPDIRRRSEAASVVQSIRDRDSYEPQGKTLYAYAAVQAWALAVETAGSTDGEAVIAVLKSRTFDTVMGRIGFDASGDVTGVSAFVWYKWSGDDYVPVN